MKVLLLSLATAVSFYAQTCTQTFSPSSVGTSPYPGSNVNTAIKNGAAGTVLCFAGGTYGVLDLYGANPPGMVTMIPAPGASAVILGQVKLNGVSNLTIKNFNKSSASRISGGFSIFNASLGSSKNIVFTDNDMGSSPIVVRDNDIANANILITNNTITGFRAGSGYEPAIIVINTRASNCPNGITIQNNHVNGSQGDGLGTGGSACGTKFIGNIVENFVQSSCGSTHCDGFQDNGGGRQTLIEGNFFYNNTVCFGLYDGSSEVVIRNNVCAMSSDSYYWMQFGGAKTITFDHNTIRGGAGASFGNDHRGNSSSNVRFTNNILPAQPSQNAGQPISGTFISDYNLCPSGCNGANSIRGNPIYSGGSNPATFVGYVLATSSLGRNGGSDGRDIGINSSVQPTQPAPPTNLSLVVK